VVRHGYDGTSQSDFYRLVSTDIAGKSHPGWIQCPAQSAYSTKIEFVAESR
jgi:hypothetical protein